MGFDPASGGAGDIQRLQNPTQGIVGRIEQNGVFELTYSQKAGIRVHRLAASSENGLKLAPGSGELNSHFSQIGHVNINNLADVAVMTMAPMLPSVRGLVITGATGQTANLQEWKDASGTLRGFVEEDSFVFGYPVEYMQSHRR